MKASKLNQNEKHNETRAEMLPGGNWIMSEGKNNHRPKVTKSISNLKTPHHFYATVVIGKEVYEIIYSKYDREIQVCAVDGHTDIEETYKERFITKVIEDIEEQRASDNGNNGRYEFE